MIYTNRRKALWGRMGLKWKAVGLYVHIDRYLLYVCVSMFMHIDRYLPQIDCRRYFNMCNLSQYVICYIVSDVDIIAYNMLFIIYVSFIS